MFLGHIVGSEGIKVDLKKTAVVGDWAVPQNVSALCTFLGLTDYFLRFVQGYVNLVGSLTNLLQKDAPFVWDADCQAAFDSVKLALTTAPVVVMLEYDKSLSRLQMHLLVVSGLAARGRPKCLPVSSVHCFCAEIWCR